MVAGSDAGGTRMAQESTRPQNITLDDLIATSTRSVARSLREEGFDKLRVPPKIWVGIWVDYEKVFQQLGTDVGNP